MPSITYLLLTSARFLEGCPFGVENILDTHCLSQRGSHHVNGLKPDKH
jgi:hypothetical protein